MTVKTLHLTNAFNDQSGGIATFYRALIDAANRQGREIRLVVPAEADSVEPVGVFGKIYHVRAPRAPLNDRYRLLYPQQFLFPNGKIQQILAAERPDVVEICDKYNLNYLGAVLRLGLIRKIDFRPLVVGLSCERMDDNFATYLNARLLERRFCSWYMRWIYFPFFDHHIAVSRHTAEELADASTGHAVQRGIWIRHMGVDTHGFSPSRRSAATRAWLRAQASAREDTKLLLYAGRLAPEKNLGLLVDVVRNLSARGLDCRLILAGDGMDRERLQVLAEQLVPGMVCFLGHVGRRDLLADVYANCDVFVHANPREPFGIAPLEAMASGIPLVAPDAGGVTSYANQDNAFLAHADEESFCAAVLAALDTNMPHARVAAALKTAEEFRWEQATDSYLNLYEALYRAFRGEPNAEAGTPYALSTPATVSRGAAISAAAWVAGNVFRLVVNAGSLLRAASRAGEGERRIRLTEVPQAQRVAGIGPENPSVDTLEQS